MKIIAVYGVNDSGKSASIKRFIDKTISHKEFILSCNEQFGRGDDVFCITDYKDGKKTVKVGIVSQGDTKEALRNAFEKFEGCDIVVCACRTKGGSEKYLSKIAKDTNDYLLWIGKSRISLWKGNQTKKGVKMLQESTVEFISEMIYRAFFLLLEME